MPIAKPANQRIEFARAKKFLAEPEPPKDQVVVLPGRTNILKIFWIFLLNKDTCLWKHGFKTRQEEKLFDEVKYKVYIHPNEVSPRIILSIPKKDGSQSIYLLLAKQSSWLTIDKVTGSSLDDNPPSSNNNNLPPSNNNPPSFRHRITSTQQSITQTQESG